MVVLAGLEAFLGRLGAILGPLGPNLDRFGRPRGPKREAKRDPRATQNDTQILIDSWSDLGAIWAKSPAGFRWGVADCAPPVLFGKLANLAI